MKSLIQKVGNTYGHCCVSHKPATLASFPSYSSRKAYKRIIWGLLLACVLCPLSNFGQIIEESNLLNFEYELEELSNQEDTLRFSFDLGSASTPAADIVGYELNVVFPALQSQPDEVGISLNGSWVGTLSGGTLNQAYNSETDQFSFDYLRSDSTGQTGSGLTAEIFLIREEGFDPLEAEILLEDGLVMVENIDFKRLPTDHTSSPSEFSVFPNPATDYLNITPTKNETYHTRLLTLQGREVLSRTNQSPQKIEVNGLPKGVYLLEIDQAGSSLQYKRVVIR